MSPARFIPALCAALVGAFSSALICDIRGPRLFLLALAASVGALVGPPIYVRRKVKRLPD
jgi:hypothetical protein